MMKDCLKPITASTFLLSLRKNKKMELIKFKKAPEFYRTKSITFFKLRRVQEFQTKCPQKSKVSPALSVYHFSITCRNSIRP